MIPTVFSEFDRHPKLPEASVATAINERDDTIKMLGEGAEEQIQSDTFYEVGEDGEAEL